MIEVAKTDSRHTGSEKFKYFAVVKGNPLTHVSWQGASYAKTVRLQKLEEFDNVRKWCVETWGMSCERSLYLMMHGSKQLNPHWCWHTEYDNFKIYFASEAEATWFKLKWK